MFAWSLEELHGYRIISGSNPPVDFVVTSVGGGATSRWATVEIRTEGGETRTERLDSGRPGLVTITKGVTVRTVRCPEKERRIKLCFERYPETYPEFEPKTYKN